MVFRLAFFSVLFWQCCIAQASSPLQLTSLDTSDANARAQSNHDGNSDELWQIREPQTNDVHHQLTTSPSRATDLSELEQQGHTIDGKTLHEIIINGIYDEQQLANAYVFLTLNKVIDKVIEQPDYTEYLIKKGLDDIAKSQQPFGFYNVDVQLNRKINGNNLTIIYEVTLNEPTRLNEVEVRLDGPANNDEAYIELISYVPMESGEVLNHQTYEAYKSEFSSLASKRGYFSGKFDESVVYVDPERNQADISLHYNSGKRYTYRSVSFNDVPLDSDLLERYVFFNQGDPYLASDVSKLQQDLQGSGYFKQTFIGAKPDKEAEVVDVDTQLTMNKPKRYAFGLGYSTDSGVRGKVDFDHRYINRRGHNFSSRLYVSEHDSYWDNIYRIPAKNPATDYYYFHFGGKLKDDKYDQKSAYVEGGYNYRRGKLEHRYSINTLYEDFTIGVDSDDVVLVYPKGSWTYTSTKNRLNPDSGFQARFELLGGSESLLSDVSFVQTNADFRYIESLGDKNKVLLRSGLGATWTDDFHRLPASLRYFAGGDRSIRGYAYESIGDRDKNGDNIGGRYLATVSAEYEYYFKSDWAAAAFVDAGDAFINNFEPVIGAGVGVHWRSPVGPIKLDVGHGFDDDYGDNYRLHISVGAELDL